MFKILDNLKSYYAFPTDNPNTADVTANTMVCITDVPASEQSPIIDFSTLLGFNDKGTLEVSTNKFHEVISNKIARKSRKKRSRESSEEEITKPRKKSRVDKTPEHQQVEQDELHSMDSHLHSPATISAAPLPRPGSEPLDVEVIARIQHQMSTDMTRFLHFTFPRMLHLCGMTWESFFVWVNQISQQEGQTSTAQPVGEEVLPPVVYESDEDLCDGTVDSPDLDNDDRQPVKQFLHEESGTQGTQYDYGLLEHSSRPILANNCGQDDVSINDLHRELVNVTQDIQRTYELPPQTAEIQSAPESPDFAESLYDVQNQVIGAPSLDFFEGFDFNEFFNNQQVDESSVSVPHQVGLHTWGGLSCATTVFTV